MEGIVLPDFDVWMEEMLRDVDTERSHLHHVQVGGEEHDGDSL